MECRESVCFFIFSLSAACTLTILSDSISEEAQRTLQREYTHTRTVREMRASVRSRVLTRDSNTHTKTLLAVKEPSPRGCSGRMGRTDGRMDVERRHVKGASHPRMKAGGGQTSPPTPPYLVLQLGLLEFVCKSEEFSVASVTSHPTLSRVQQRNLP